MDTHKLASLEHTFLLDHPQGVSTSSHDAKLIELAQKNLTTENLASYKALDTILELVMEASLVTFLKKKHFQEALESMDYVSLQDLQRAVYELLYGAEKEGFSALEAILSPYKAAPWEIITVLRRYCYPATDFILKPLQANRILTRYELTDLTYVTKPTFSFYSDFRDALKVLKQEVGPLLSNSAQNFLLFLDKAQPTHTAR